MTYPKRFPEKVGDEEFKCTSETIHCMLTGNKHFFNVQSQSFFSTNHIIVSGNDPFHRLTIYIIVRIFSGQASGRTSSRSGFRRYVIFATAISISIVAVTFILGETKVVDIGYGMKQILLDTRY